MSVRQQVGVGCLMVVAAVVTAGLAVTLGGVRGLSSSNAYVAPIADAAGLSVGSVVAVRGVEVGRVTALELDGDEAIVRFEVDTAVRVAASATASVRARSLLGEKYVALDPGAGEPLPDGAALPAMGEQYEVDELVAVLTPLLAAVDPEALAQASRALGAAMAEDPERVGRMLADAEVALANAADASADLGPLVRDGRVAVGEARVAVAELTQRAREAERLIARADAAVASLDEASEPLPATIDEARAALADAKQLIRRLDEAVVASDGLIELLGELDRDGIHEVLLEDGVRVRLFRQRPRGEDAR